jgi:hypothetical protein
MADVSENVPQTYKDLGFSGLFSVETALGGPDEPLTPEQVDEFEAKLPARVPFGSNSGWLALRVNREAVPPTVVLVRRDAEAVTEAAVRPQGGKEQTWQGDNVVSIRPPKDRL